ncbi:hypothetical protein L1987_67161 [Smallanthus sonchifolius]|uniref:Uncharacterized protein n=1 Tax=Smallanthus sonchifolius TaxID=185202 RepID=A0ACB9BZB1_9ASTR|nr:hypothetical protein L1987_67161 [Smallanthus sonchifolius]
MKNGPYKFSLLMHNYAVEEILVKGDNTKYTYRNRKETPSFSSTLLDIIYQSVDATEDEDSVVYKRATRNRQSIDGCCSQVEKQIVDSLRRTGDSKNIGDVVFRRKSAIGVSQRSEDNIGYSRSRYRSQISSSEAERINGFPARLRPLRIGINEDDEFSTREINRNMYGQKYQTDNLPPRANCEGKFVKTKSRAMKIYSYLKKAKHPISPGGRFASFLLSLFGTTNAKKSKISSPVVHANRKYESTRSCLKETPSSNVIDEYSQSRGHKSLKGDRSRSRSDSPAVKFAMNSIDKKLEVHSTEKNLHIEESTRDLLKSYRKKVECVFDSIKNSETNNNDDDEVASYASSDLFELGHLSAIGIDRCMQELPLYETTSVDVNQAIANGLLV